jgi:ADP-ribose pyrophosphatase YjhB (NUDIX family)
MVNIHFCTQCGSDEVELLIPEGDNRIRHVCGSCGFIHYSNPKVVAGCIVTHQDQILFCRRAIEPRKGLWTLPAGFMENHETTVHAAKRETWEEARAKVRIKGLYTLFNLPHISQIYMMYRGELIGEAFGPGPESLEVELMTVAEIPWDDLAFPTIRETLKLFVEDWKTGQFPLHCADIIRPWVMLDSKNAYLRNLVTH